MHLDDSWCIYVIRFKPIIMFLFIIYFEKVTSKVSPSYRHITYIIACHGNLFRHMTFVFLAGSNLYNGWLLLKFVVDVVICRVTTGGRGSTYIVHSYAVVCKQGPTDLIFNTNIFNVKLWPLITDIHSKTLPFLLASYTSISHTSGIHITKD